MALNIGSSTIGGDDSTVKQITEAIRIDLIEAAKEIANKNLDALVEKVDTMWVGVTADQFKEKIKSDKQKFGKIMDLLYEEVEQDITQMEKNIVNADSYVAANMGVNGGGGGGGTSSPSPTPTAPTQPQEPSVPEQPVEPQPQPQPQQPSTPPSEDDILKIISDEPTDEPGTQDGGITPGGTPEQPTAPELPDDFEERYKKDIEQLVGGGEDTKPEDTKPGTGDSEPGNPAPTEEEKKAQEEAAKKAEEEAAKKAAEEEEAKKKAEEEQKAKEEEERKAKEEEERKAKEEEERKAKEEEERKAKEEEERKAKEEEEKKKAEEEAAKKAAEEEAAKKTAEEEVAKKAAEEEAAKKAAEEAAQLQPTENPGLSSPGEVTTPSTEVTSAPIANGLDVAMQTAFAEGAYDSEEAARKIADVILNRALNSGTSIGDVVAAKGQFSAYSGGMSGHGNWGWNNYGSGPSAGSIGTERVQQIFMEELNKAVSGQPLAYDYTGFSASGDNRTNVYH